MCGFQMLETFPLKDRRLHEVGEAIQKSQYEKSGKVDPEIKQIKEQVRGTSRVGMEG